jgi:hypothetical protein
MKIQITLEIDGEKLMLQQVPKTAGRTADGRTWTARISEILHQYYGKDWVLNEAATITIIKEINAVGL